MHLNWAAPVNPKADGKLYLVRCYECDPKNGRENWAGAVASGTCAWCGWSATQHAVLLEDGEETNP